MEEWYKSKEITSLKSRYCSVNYRHVSYALGVLILVEAGLLALCAAISFYYQEEEYIHFLQTLLINVVLGGLMLLVGKRNEVLSIGAMATALSVYRGYCFRHWACCLFCLVDISLP